MIFSRSVNDDIFFVLRTRDFSFQFNFATFTIESASKSQTLVYNLKYRIKKRNKLLKLVEMKVNAPKPTQKRIAKEMGIPEKKQLKVTEMT